MTLPISYKKIKQANNVIKDEEGINQEKEILKEKEVFFDFKTNRFIYEGLEPKHIYTRIEIIKQWITKLFYTERDRWNCYILNKGYPFGIDLLKYRGKELYPHMDVVELIKSDIYNSLLNHKEIEEVHHLQLIQVDDVMYCGFIVELEDTAFEIEEVLKIDRENR